MPPSNFALQRAENYSDCRRYGKTGNKKHSTCFAPLLQNELHIKPVLHQIKLLTGLKVAGKMCKISLELFCSNGAKKVACFLSPVFPYFSVQPVPSASTTKSAVFYRLLFSEVCPENRFFREFVPKNPVKFDFFFRDLSEAQKCGKNRQQKTCNLFCSGDSEDRGKPVLEFLCG